MKLSKSLASLILLGSLFVTACGSNNPSTSSTESSQIIISTTSQAPSYPDIPDVTAFTTGDYIVGKLIYRLNKENKSIKVIDFDTDYNKYVADDGTLKATYTVRFVDYNGRQAIMFVADSKDTFMYKDPTLGTLTIARISESGISSQTIHKFPADAMLPTYGTYVSPQLEQYKVDEQGKRIPDGEGGYVKENFYLMLEINATKAELFVSEDGETHGATPLHQVSNYKCSYNNGGVLIKIPHQNADYSCSLVPASASTIRFNNSYEKYGDYSGDGIFTLVPQE